MRRKIQKLREEARHKLLSRLNVQQQQEVEQLIGESFDFSRSTFARQDESKDKK